MGKSYLISIIATLIVSAIYIISLVFGGLTLQAQNDAPILLSDNPNLNNLYVSLNDSVNDANDNVDNAYQAFTNSSIITTGVTPFLSAIGGVWKLMINAPVQIFTAIFDFLGAMIFNGPTGILFIGGVGAILLLMLISAVIKLVSRGEGD